MSQIKVGDLAVILRGCCRHKFAGAIGTVEAIKQIPSGINNGGCGHAFKSYVGAHVAGTPDYLWPPLEWLKRIPPLEELEGERTEETLQEPA